MPKTVTTTTTIDFALRYAEVKATAGGYRLILHGHEVTTVGGVAVDTTLKDVEAPVDPVLAAQIDADVGAVRATYS